jgi:hypothetical protein
MVSVRPFCSKIVSICGLVARFAAQSVVKLTLSHWSPILLFFLSFCFHYLGLVPSVFIIELFLFS